MDATCHGTPRVVEAFRGVSQAFSRWVISRQPDQVTHHVLVRRLDSLIHHAVLSKIAYLVLSTVPASAKAWRRLRHVAQRPHCISPPRKQDQVRSRGIPMAYPNLITAGLVRSISGARSWH